MARRLLLKQNTLDSYSNPNNDYSFIGYQASTLSEKLSNSTFAVFQNRTPDLSTVLKINNQVGNNSIDFTGDFAIEIQPSILVYKRIEVDDVELYATESQNWYVSVDSFIDNPANPNIGQNYSFSRFSITGIEFGAIESNKIIGLSETLGIDGLKIASKSERVSIVGIEGISMEILSTIYEEGSITNLFKINIFGVETFSISYDDSLIAKISILVPTFSDNNSAISAGLTAGNLYIEALTGAIKIII